MPASYPSSVKFFSTKVTGQTIEAAHINEPQDEITAIEQGLLQGLQHDLIPDSSDTRSVGSNSRQWLQAVLKRLRVGDSPGITRVRTITSGGATETWITVNADYDGTNWNRDDTAKPARAIRISDDKTVDYLYATSGANPITWSGPQIKVISTGSGLQLQGDPTDPLHAATKQYVDNLQRYHTVQSNGTAQTQRYILNFTTGLSASDDSVNTRTNVSVVNDTTIQKVEVAKAGVLAGTRKRINFIEGQGVAISASDDSTNNRVNVTFSSPNDTTTQRVEVAKNNALVGTRKRVNFIEGQGVAISASDDATNNEVDVTFSAPNDTTIQRVEVAKAGVLAGTRKRINFIEGQGITITTSDDTTNNKVDVTIASSGTSGTQVKPFLVATSANIPPFNGATLVRVDTTNETWYELVYPDGYATVADFEIPAVSFSQVRFVWRTSDTSGTCVWVLSVREKGPGDLLGGGTPVVQATVVDPAPGTAYQLKEVTVNLNYTPGPNKRCALLGIDRNGVVAEDTLGAPARLLWVELL